MAMFVGVGTLELRIYDLDSLKAKTGVVRKIMRRARERFPISICEVEMQQDLEQSVLGFTSVGTNESATKTLMNRVIEFIESLHMANVISADYTVEGF